MLHSLQILGGSHPIIIPDMDLSFSEMDFSNICRIERPLEALLLALVTELLEKPSDKKQSSVKPWVPTDP